MIAFITFNSSLVPLFESLRSSNSWEFEFSGFGQNRTDDLGINSTLLWPTEPRLHVRSQWTIQLVPEPRKIAWITAQRQRGTWEGVPVATWCCEWICRIERGLIHHIFIISPAFYLSSVAWVAAGRAPTILSNEVFCAGFSNFLNSLVFPTTVFFLRLEFNWKLMIRISFHSIAFVFLVVMPPYN